MLGLFDFLRRPAVKRSARQKAGDAGERAAERFLRKAGFRIVARNVTYPEGEVDLVTVEKSTGTLCFVEVRSRKIFDGDRGPKITPEESVTPAKRRKVIRAARQFALERKAADMVLRFDVVTVRFAADDHAPPDIRHYPGAFDGRGRLL
jgi:putative endonuclease